VIHDRPTYTATDRVPTRAEAEAAAADVLAHATRTYVGAAVDFAVFVRAEAAERADLAGYVRMRAGNCRRTEAAAIAVGDVLAAATPEVALLPPESRALLLRRPLVPDRAAVRAWRHFGGDYGFLTKYPQARFAASIENGFDQIKWLVAEIKKNPSSRRLVVSAWHPVDAGVVALPPCHTLFQCCVQGPRDGSTATRKRLSLHLYMRSADYFLGVPFNIASYALLTHLLAREADLDAGTLTVSFGDVHLYRNHLDQAREQLSREPRLLPKVLFQGDHTEVPTSILDPGWRKEHVSIVGYDPHPAIKAAVSV